MGTVISKAASGVGSVLGNAFVAPFKTIFGRSCEGVCSGTWDITCFIEHLCISSLVRLLMVGVLAYITLLFFYLLFKVGIIQCIGRSLCKMTWAACETYWTAIGEISCFLWHKLKNTKRVYRHRFDAMEEGFSSSYSDDSSENLGTSWVIMKPRLDREKRRYQRQKSLYRGGSYRSSSRHHVRLKTREVSVHVRGSGRMKNSRALQIRNKYNHNGQHPFKKRRI